MTAQASSILQLETAPPSSTPVPSVGEDSLEGPAALAVDPNYAFSARKNEDGSVVLAGQLPADAALRYAAAATGGNVDAVSIAPGAPATFGSSLQAGIRALQVLDSGALDFAAGRWRLSGQAASAEDAAAAMSLLPADASEWTVDIQTPAAATATPATSPGPLSPGAARCADVLAEFSGRNAILFRSGSSQIAPESGPFLDELAADLALCPDELIHIEGHTDSDGDELSNLALSVARAEAVGAALVTRGVSARRLYALGFGETTPVASNDTPEGKRQNRRIVIKLAPPEQN